MDSSGQYSPSGMSQRQQLFQSSQLPPPSALSSLSFARTNTLPPLAALSSAAAARYPPPTYSHPSLSNTAASPLPLSSLSSSSTLPWPSHRTSSSRDEQISPPLSLRHSDSRSKLVDREDQHVQQQRQEEQASTSQSVKHEGEDGMPSTSDFVKKLYKYVSTS